MEITFKIPSKLILFGEHAVLDGARGISAAISLVGRGKSVISDSSEGILNLIFENEKIGEVGQVPPGTRTEFSLPFLPGCGLGSSAMIATVIGILQVLSDGESIDKEKLRKKAMDQEKLFCPKISGIDHSTVIEGGIVSFSISTNSPEQIPNFIFKKNKLILWNSGIQKNTKNEIEGTWKIQNRKEIIFRISEICEEAHKEITKEDPDLKEIHRLMKENQELLELLGLCPEAMKNEILEMRKLGMEAKISGAGNGGYLYSIVPKDFQNRKDWIECQIDFDGVEVTVGKKT